MSPLVNLTQMSLWVLMTLDSKKIAITINFNVFLLWKQLANEVIIF